MKKFISIPLLAAMSITLCSCKNLVKPLNEGQALSYEQVATRSYRGKTFARNYTFLAGYKYQEDGSAKRIFAPDIPYAFSNVLGNRGAEKCGIEYEYDELLRLKSINQIDANSGISIVTTFDSDMQESIYDMIALNFRDFIGSVIVLKQNGEILADISYPSFNHIDFEENAGFIEQNISFRNQSLVEKKLHMRNLPNINDLINDPDSALEDIHFYDTDFLDCDFGKINNHIIDNDEGFMEVSPIYMASLLRKTLVSDGVMPKPFTILEFTDPDDRTIKFTADTVLKKLKNAKDAGKSDVDDERIKRWERIFNENKTNAEITLSHDQFNESYYDGKIGCFKPKLDESKYSFAGKISTEKQESFWCYGMILNKEEPNESLIIVSENSYGIKDKTKQQEFFQMLINSITNETD